jgi:galactokinase
MNKLTDNEIVKSLESLLDRMRAYESQQGSIGKGLVEDIISMYNRQKAEIERLQKHNEIVLENCRQYNEANDKANNQRFLEAIDAVKSEAIKEFAERLKEMPSVMNCEYEWLHTDIDNLVKEMTEQRGEGK